MDTLKTKDPKIKACGTIARLLCIMDKSPVDRASAQIIIPAKESGRKTDIYISVMSNALSVAPKDKYTAMISSRVFEKTEKAQREELTLATKILTASGGKII